MKHFLNQKIGFQRLELLWWKRVNFNKWSLEPQTYSQLWKEIERADINYLQFLRKMKGHFLPQRTRFGQIKQSILLSHLMYFKSKYRFPPIFTYFYSSIKSLKCSRTKHQWSTLKHAEIVYSIRSAFFIKIIRQHFLQKFADLSHKNPHNKNLNKTKSLQCFSNSGFLETINNFNSVIFWVFGLSNFYSWH